MNASATMGGVKPSWQRLRQGSALLAASILLLLVADGGWVPYVGLALGLAGAVVVLTAVGRPRRGETPPFLD